MEYDVVIGIEIHCELKTATKMFSSAPCVFGAKANTCVNEVDLGHPGTMPCVNKEAVKKAIQICTALHLEIDPLVKFDRKNYYYSDLPKGFQITQQFHPIGKNGYIMIDVEGEKKKIRINRIHMEEDTAKQFHLNDISLIDYNRAGTPLVEIVSEPDMQNGKEAAAYVEALRQTLYYLGVSDVKMEEGSMRCDVNVSLKPKGSNVFGTKNEIKNLNSIANVQKAIDYEVARQKELLEKGEKIEQATRRYDENLKETVLMRKKEGNVDYKFFPEPNIFPIMLDANWIKKIQEELPELPDVRKERYAKEYGLNDYDISVLIANKELADTYEKVMKTAKNPKMACNWMLSDVSAWINKNNGSFAKINCEYLGQLINMVDAKEISNSQAKDIVLPEVMQDKDPKAIVEAKGLKQVSDSSAILAIVKEVLAEQTQSVEDYKNGKDRALKFMVGQVMKKSKGQANPQMANQLLLEELAKLINN
ncbi:MAG: Asp-tRNA(Asn)/Glu-tRNA(Gln) amidotransferase subunit GatB [Erysipelotrichaceae bacterium]|nr:Asp-tRNA(Asn)/Glu-tRNA(Gln) amidotransferase subunit GatB [Erysipelotrichaceae bacterium]MDY5251993.1 Asp-tRNA(Asn)/Glu-tRNA(Gln) amidotransferase subunit GatB [Erysipelotrichaceae bacterium]